MKVGYISVGNMGGPMCRNIIKKSNHAVTVFDLNPAAAKTSTDLGATAAKSVAEATKGAVRLFTKATAIQHATDNIRCNSVHPGPIDTDMIRDTLSDAALREERLNRVPLRRIGRPEDVAYGVLYLASDESSFVTGSELVIDGGTTAQ